MPLTKDGFYKQIGNELGDNSYILLAGGGHKKENELYVAYASNADAVDNYHANQLLEAFSNTGLTSSGNTITLGSFNVKVGGKSLGTNASGVKIINSNTLSNGKITSNDNVISLSALTSTINGITATNVGSTATIINSNDIGGGALASGNNKISISKLISRVNGITGSNDGTTATIIASNTLTGGGLTTNENYISTSSIYSIVNGVTGAITSGLTVSIIKGVSINSFTQGNTSNLSIVLNVNGVTAGATLTKLYANNTYLFDGKRPNELFTQFDKNGRITRITIGGETKEHTISYSYESDLSERTGKLNSPVNITLKSSLYPTFDGLTQNDYVVSNWYGNTNIVLQLPPSFENAVKTIEEVTAYALNDVRNQIIDIDLGSKFTEFSDAGSQNTRITIGTETKDLKIDADKLDGKHANELLESFSTSGLTSSGNTIVLSQINLTVGGKSLTTSISSTKIINSNTLSGGALGSGTNYMSRAPIYSVVNGVTGAITAGSTVSIINSNDISGGALASGNNKISISKLISRVNGITGSNDGTTVTIVASNTLTGGGLTTNENYISTSSIYSIVNGVTGAITSGLTVSIIKGVSINSFTQGTTTSLKIELNVNGITAGATIDKLYAYSATNLGGTAPKDLFSEFIDGGNDQTQITIAGETKQLKIPYAYRSSYLGGKTLGGLLTSFTGGGLTSTGNTITQLNHYIAVGGVTKYAGSSSVKIINGLSVYGLTSSSSTNLKIDLNINGVTTSQSLTNIYATDSTKLGGKTLGGLFTEFGKGDGNQTKITIGGTTKQYAISYSYESDYSNRAGKFNTPIDITLQSTLYPGSYTYTGFNGSGNLVLKVPEELEQSIKTIEEVTAYALNDLRNQIVDIDLNDNFTEFSNAGGQTTRITIGHATKELQIDADKVDGFNADELLGGFSGGVLSSNGNTLTLSQTNIVVGGKTLSLDASNTPIINSLSVGGLTSTTNNNLSLSITINGKTSNAAGLTKLYAHDAANLGGTAPEDLFSEFIDGGSDQTQITIAGETKQLKIPYAYHSTYLGGKTLGGLFDSFSGGGLTSTGNTITQFNHYICVGGVTRSAGSSSIKIINGLSVYGLTSSSSTNLTINLNINGVTTTKSLTNIYATDSTKLGGKTLGGLFTEFEKGDGNQTKITIGGTTKQYAISYSYESDYSNRAGKLNNPINVTLKSSLYPTFDGLTQNDYVASSWAGNTNLVLQLPPSFENAVKTIEEVTAYALNDLRNQIVDIDLNDNFTEFTNAGNQNTRITVGNVTKDLKIDADKVDGYEANTLLEAFSNTGLTSSGNTITLGSFNVKVGGKSLGINASGVKIINSNTLSGGALGSSTNYMSRAPIYSVVNGVTGAITAGSTVSIINSNDITGGGLASGNNKISISKLISKVNGITGANDGTTVTIVETNTLSGGALGSSTNYMSRAPIYSVVNGVTGAITAGSTVSIINGLSIYSLTPGITVNLTLGLNINGVTTTKGITNLYARYADEFRRGVTVTLKSSLYPTFDGLSINDSIITNWYGNTALVLSLPPSLENSIKTIEEVTAYALNDLRNQVLDVRNEVYDLDNRDNLTEFSNSANETTRITVGNVTKQLRIHAAWAADADTVDNYHANELLEAFSNNGLTSSGNTITLGSFNVKVGGKSLGTNKSGVKIINGLSVYGLTSSSSTNLTIDLNINGVTTSKSISKLYASATNISTTWQEPTNESGHNPGSGGYKGSLDSTTISWVENSRYADESGHSHSASVAISAVNADKVDGYEANTLLEAFSNNGLTSSGNTITLGSFNVKVGGKSLGTSASGVKIINSNTLSGGALSSGTNYMSRAPIYSVVNGITGAISTGSTASIITGLTIYSFVSTTQKNLSIGINVNGVTASAEITTLYAGAGSGNSVAPSSNISEFSGGALSVSGNTISQGNHFIVTSDGNTFSAGASGVRIINGLSIYSLSSTSSTNLQIYLNINGVTTSKSLGSIWADNATNADKVDGYHVVSGSTWGCLKIVGNDGVIEIGRYIDFHYAAGETCDYSARLQINSQPSSGNGPIVVMPSESGTLVTDKYEKGYSMSEYWIDYSGQSVNYYYPVTFDLDAHKKDNVRIEVLVALDSGVKPSWSDHTNGFSCKAIWEVNGSGWGSTKISRTVYAWDWGWCNGTNGQCPMANIGQLSNNSIEYILLRGGGKYRIRTSHGVVPTKNTSTVNGNGGQSISTYYYNDSSLNLNGYSTNPDISSGWETGLFGNAYGLFNNMTYSSNTLSIIIGGTKRTCTINASSGGTTYYAGTGISISGSTISLANVGSGDSSTQYKVVGVNTGTLNALKYRTEFYFTDSGAYHTSDANKKYDIRDILNEDVNRLFETDNGYIRHFKWKSTDEDAYGFIAQELQEYCPEAVDMNQEDKSLAVNYNVALSKVIGAMFKKLKQQDIIIKGLEYKLKEKEDS